jgi:hypothetical protein
MYVYVEQRKLISIMRLIMGNLSIAGQAGGSRLDGPAAPQVSLTAGSWTPFLGPSWCPASRPMSCLSLLCFPYPLTRHGDSLPTKPTVERKGTTMCRWVVFGRDPTTMRVAELKAAILQLGGDPSGHTPPISGALRSRAELDCALSFVCRLTPLNICTFLRT